MLRGAPVRRGGLGRLATQAAVVVLALAAWQAVLALKLVPRWSVPAPAAVLARLGALLTEGVYWKAVAQTCWSWALGLGLSAAIGVPAGLAIGMSRFAMGSTRLVIDFLRTIPPVALVPLALLLYGPTLPMKLVLVVTGSVWPLIVQSIYASHQLDPTLRQVASSFRLTLRHRIRYLFVPSATPFVSTGFRVAATISLLLCITAELIGGAPGIGYSLGQAEIGGDLPEMYAYVITAGGLGVLINTGLLGAQRRLLWWHPSVRTGAR
ncbi:MAG: ABC transporter permease subunit [Deltaproteobacteria bacterium]|nr:ABC transporter permease subunit [Deltaproteobacteria bacterium]